MRVDLNSQIRDCEIGLSNSGISQAGLSVTPGSG
jgi:hypothetical protein